MDIISISVATDNALIKLKEDGIEGLTLNGTDGKQYQLAVKNGKLELSVKESGGGGDAELFTFTINSGRDGTLTLMAERGMTWAEWVNSPYNEGLFIVDTAWDGSSVIRHESEMFSYYVVHTCEGHFDAWVHSDEEITACCEYMCNP